MCRGVRRSTFPLKYELVKANGESCEYRLILNKLARLHQSKKVLSLPCPDLFLSRTHVKSKPRETGGAGIGGGGEQEGGGLAVGGHRARGDAGAAAERRKVTTR